MDVYDYTYQQTLCALCALCGESSSSQQAFQICIMRQFFKGDTLQIAAQLRNLDGGQYLIGKSEHQHIARLIFGEPSRAKIEELIHVELTDGDRVDHADPEAELIASETAGRLQDGMGRLSPLQREVFLLRVEQGLDYADIAAALDTTPGAARVHYHHAVKRLKERLQ